MNQNIVARQIDALAKDMTDIAAAMFAEIKRNEKVAEEADRQKSDEILKPSMAQYPAGFFRAKLAFVGKNLQETLEYMDKTNTW